MLFVIGWKEGEGVISRNFYGEGKAYYVGTGIEDELLSQLLLHIINEEHIKKAPFRLKNGIEVIERLYNGRNVYCIFNFLKEEIHFKLDKNYRNMINGETLIDELIIGPKEYMVISNS